jgi:hypothetical protein
MKKKSPSKKTKRPSNLMIIGSVFAALVVVFVSWSWYVHFQDKQKFMTLKQDMLTLRAEFNKIDPGWTYSEGCHAKGEKFKENEASSCGASLTNIDSRDLDMYLNIIQKLFTVKSNSSFTDSLGRYQNNRVLQYAKTDSINCEIGSIKNADSKFTNGLSCSGSALEFYFPKTQ